MKHLTASQQTVLMTKIATVRGEMIRYRAEHPEDEHSLYMVDVRGAIKALNFATEYVHDHRYVDALNAVTETACGLSEAFDYYPQGRDTAPLVALHKTAYDLIRIVREAIR